MSVSYFLRIRKPFVGLFALMLFLAWLEALAETFCNCLSKHCRHLKGTAA
jgi:hypothetical protein